MPESIVARKIGDEEHAVLYIFTNLEKKNKEKKQIRYAEKKIRRGRYYSGVPYIKTPWVIKKIQDVAKNKAVS